MTDTPEKPCPFCHPDASRVFHEAPLILGLWDGYPASPGHALLVPRRHVADWFAASAAEQQALLEAIPVARDAILARGHSPDGFNIGVNVGYAAGQTVMHVHLHVIPRYTGDVPDPTGGVRLAIPDKGNYLRPARPAKAGSTDTDLLIPGETFPLLPHLTAELARANRADIAVAFVKHTGVERLREHLVDFLDRGGALRLVAGDYLTITDPGALSQLLDLSGEREIRVFECPEGKSFHPKAYIFHHHDSGGVAFVGSSNLSRSALSDAVEWNYRVVSSGSPGFTSITAAFEALYADPRTRAVTAKWIAGYAARQRRDLGATPVRTDVEPEPELPPPEPHAIQREALEALERTRAEGNAAGLVVLATGLGKTWLSAFDSACSSRSGGEGGGSKPYERVLFVAHREEILSQAMSTFRRIRPTAHFGRYTGAEKTPSADVLFASVQTLGRARHLLAFDPRAFDYIIVDEFHHACARTYRQLIEHFEPRFLLGLTATPERTDGGDLLELCGENLVYRADLAAGIGAELLCPFSYFGVPDEVDYANIPWRSSRFDEQALTAALATQRRADNALGQLRSRGGRRTLAFCCSQRHADFMAGFFTEAGLRAVAVHAGPDSAPRASSLEQLEAGELDVICAVDMFNEGVDLPHVDTVLMLRPTESRIVWLQQLGRGLRRPDGDKRLTIIDYIGNHRTFLLKPQTLLGLESSDAAVDRALSALLAGELELPPGCEVTYDLEAVEILRALLRRPSQEEAIRFFYQDFTERRGDRPRAAEAYHEGYNPRSLRRYHGSWFDFVRGMDGLDAGEQAALEQAAGFLRALETTQMTRSYKMVLVLAMLNADGLPGSIDLDTLAGAVARLAGRSARLRDDFPVGLSDLEHLKQLLEKNPIAAWTGGKGTGGTAYFAFEDGVLRTRLPDAPELRQPMQRMVRELCEWRLAEYLDRSVESELSTADRFICRVNHAGGRPIIHPLDRERTPGIPVGWTPVIADGERYEANFVKIAVNVMRRPGSTDNVLARVLRGWFGEDAGLPGTRYVVSFERTDDGWVMAPAGFVEEPEGPRPWGTYTRQQVAELFGLPYDAQVWQQGFVPRPGHLFLFVTLDKGDVGEDYQYRDHFLAPDRLQWQSQNRTTQHSKHGRLIRDHEQEKVAVHLLVRPAKRAAGRSAPFYYGGALRFEGWEGEKPITVRWQLDSAVPEGLRGMMAVPP